jgi:PilZ domain
LSDKDHRRQPRFVVEGLHGRMTFASEVEIVNMSLSGVALKLDRRLNIGTEYTLKLEVNDKTLAVKGLIVWSALDERKKGPRGEDVLVYSAGMKFTDVLTQRLMELVAFIDENKLIEEKRLGGVRFYIDAPGKALLDVPRPYHVKVISIRGMLIEADYRMELEARCPMEMTMREGEPPLCFVGRVAFCGEASTESGLHQLGIEFVDLSSADRRRLDSFIQSLAKG